MDCLIIKMTFRSKKYREQFKTIVSENYTMVYRTCYSILLNKEDAEDLSQEVFAKAFQSFETFRKESKISTWLYRISINLSLNYKDRQSKLLIAKEEYEQFTLESDDENILQQRRKEILSRVLDKLPEKQRTFFLLNKYNGLTAKEIAEIMQCSQNSVEVTIHRAVKNISKKILEIQN